MPTNREKGVPLTVICYIFRNHPYVRIYVGQPVSSSPEAILQACVLVKEMTYFKSRLILYGTKLLEKLSIAQEAKEGLCPLWNTKDLQHFNNSPQLVLSPIRITPIRYSYITYLKLFNIIFESTTCFSELFLFLWLATKILHAFPFTVIRAQSCVYHVCFNFIILNEVISKE